MRFVTALTCILGATLLCGCNAPGYSVPGGSKSATDKKSGDNASGGNKGGAKPADKKDDVAPPPDLPDYEPLD